MKKNKLKLKKQIEIKKKNEKNMIINTKKLKRKV